MEKADRGGIVVQYRAFRNTDPPRLVALWNEIFTQRGAPRLNSSTNLERYVLGKTIFDPQGLIVAEAAGECVGFVHAGMSQHPFNPQRVGVTCLLGVQPAHRRQGIGAELLKRSEQYLRDRGADILTAGAHWPNNPFYLGLYGGCESPGFLVSDAMAEPFFLKHGYRVEQQIFVLERVLDHPMKMFDPRFVPMRQRYELEFGSPRHLLSWWHECVHGNVDPLQFVLKDRQNPSWVARTLVWEMEPFSHHWQRPTVGIFDFEVNPTYRQQGIGRFFLSLIMKYIQDQFFTLVELQLEETNHHGLQFLRSLDFQHVDTGNVYLRIPT
jgi:ribosomal protein S18 acetylase RimI-like enzyme